MRHLPVVYATCLFVAAASTSLRAADPAVSAAANATTQVKAALEAIRGQAGLLLPGSMDGHAEAAARAARIAAAEIEQAKPAPISVFMAERSLRELKDEIAAGALSAADEDIKRSVREATVAVGEAAADAGIADPLYAELVSGLLVSPNEGSQGEETGQELGAYVKWRSRYFGIAKVKAKDRAANPGMSDLELYRAKVMADHQTFRLSGRFGRAPVTALLAEAGAEIEATDVPAFVWDSRLEFARHGDATDVVAYAGGGQTWLARDSVTRSIGDDKIELALAGGRAAWMGEAGLAFNLYQKGRLDRLAGQDASPRFSASVAYRRDALLSSAKDFGKTNDRLVFRMLLAELHVFDRRDGSEAPGPFSLRFGVEHERGLTSNGAPAATRLLIAGDIHILEALGGKK